MTIVKIETYVWLDEGNSEEKDGEDATKITLAFGDALYSEGYDNVADKDPVKTTLSAVIVVSEAGDDDWKTAIRQDGVRGLDFPTGDEEFARQMSEGLLGDLS